MKVIVTDEDNQVLSTSQEWESPDINQAPYSETTYSPRERYWSSEVNEKCFNGIHLATHNVQVRQTVQVQTIDAPKLVSLFFVEKGRVQTQTKTHKDAWSISSLQHNLLFDAYSTDKTLLEKQNDLIFNIISFTPERFSELAAGAGGAVEKAANNVLKNKGFCLNETSNLQLDMRMLEIIRGIRHNHFQSDTKRLFIESAILQLLALQFEQARQEENASDHHNLSAADIKKLKLVREFLLSDIASTPTLQQLSKQTGLNNFKLKTGFKVLFGQSVFSFLRAQRMEHARKELQNENKSLSDIAYESGFASPAHFSDAFRKKYGISPNKMR